MTGGEQVGMTVEGRVIYICHLLLDEQKLDVAVDYALKSTDDNCISQAKPMSLKQDWMIRTDNIDRVSQSAMTSTNQT